MTPGAAAASALAGAGAGAAVRPAAFARSVPAGQPFRQACPHCGYPLLLPGRTRSGLVGLVRGRCPECRGRIAPPPLVMELALAAVAVLLAARYPPWTALAFDWLALVGGALALIDLAVRRLPNRLCLAAYAGTVGLLAVQALVGRGGSALLRALASGGALAVCYLVVAVATHGGLGIGDVKLAGSVGTALGWVGLGPLIAGAVAGPLLAALGALIAVAAGRLRWRQPLPLGPFLLLGAGAVLVMHG